MNITYLLNTLHVNKVHVHVYNQMHDIERIMIREIIELPYTFECD